MNLAKGLVIGSLSLIMLTPASARANAILNADFSAGNDGFTSQYLFTETDLTPPSVYTVGEDAFDFHPGAASFGDHTTGTGLMFLANGSTVPGRVVWRQTVAVHTFTDLTFSGWAASWGELGDGIDPAPAALQFLINGVQIGADFVLPAPDGEWAMFSVPWNSGPHSRATLTIVDSQLAFVGNDFALDDLSLEPGEPAPVPEPSALVLLSVGALCAGWRRRSAWSGHFRGDRR